MKVPGRELAVTVVWMVVVVGAFAAFYFLAGPGAKKAPQAPPEHREEAPARPGEEEAAPAEEAPVPREEKPAPAPEASPGEAKEEPAREPKRIFADSFDGEAPPEWERLGESRTIAAERSDGVLRVKGPSGSLDWDEAGLRTRARELDGFSASVEFKLVSNEGTGTKMFFLCAEDPDDGEAKAWVYFHPTKGGRVEAGYAAMKEGGPAKGVGAADGGRAFHTLRLALARGKLAAFVDDERLATYEMGFGKVRFGFGLRSPAEGEEVEAVFDSFLLLDWPEKPFEP